MDQYCVIVANSNTARFFTLESPEFPEYESGPNLVETKELHNPDLHDQDELWANTKTGRNRAGKSGPAHGYDDHRSQHHEEFERRFAHSIAEETRRLQGDQRHPNVILVSQQRMLGHLRQAMDNHFKDAATHEVAKDLSKLSALELHQHLARERLLPRRKGPAA